MLYFLIALLVLVGLYIFVDREIYFYEGVHLGPRVQAWLYNHWAKRYDQDKRDSQAHDPERLARPLMQALAEIPAPAVLDLATGTGRLPLALLKEGFTGHVTALDISEGMLAQAAAKLMPYASRLTLLKQTGFPLPFDDESFDAVCCLEALEVMPEMETPLRELHRLLKPGGILLTSRGTEASGRKAKVVAAADFRSLLERCGFEQIEIQPWWRCFDLVWARKRPAHD
jgi:ubiquinone/menaquinone biosynthesis C-methylase UbiE